MIKNLWNAKMVYFLKKKDEGGGGGVKFKINCFNKYTLPKDFICKDSIPARILVVFTCPKGA